MPLKLLCRPGVTHNSYCSVFCYCTINQDEKPWARRSILIALCCPYTFRWYYRQVLGSVGSNIRFRGLAIARHNISFTSVPFSFALPPPAELCWCSMSLCKCWFKCNYRWNSTHLVPESLCHPHYIVCAYLRISWRWEQMTPLGSQLKSMLIFLQHYRLGARNWFCCHMVPKCCVIRGTENWTGFVV